jgi:hypothetical protein
VRRRLRQNRATIYKRSFKKSDLTTKTCSASRARLDLWPLSSVSCRKTLAVTKGANVVLEQPYSVSHNDIVETFPIKNTKEQLDFIFRNSKPDIDSVGNL